MGLLKKFILPITTLVYLLTMGVLFIVFSLGLIQRNNTFIGLCLLFVSIPLLFAFTRKNVEALFFRIAFTILGLALFIISLITMATGEIDIDNVLVWWGVLDIITGVVEAGESTTDIVLRKQKRGFAGILLGLVEIVFGILLIVHLREGLTLHLIITGIIFLLTVVKLVLLSIFNRANYNE